MGIKFGLIIGLLVFICAIGYGIYMCFVKKLKTLSIILGVVELLFVAAFAIVPFSLHEVETGQIAVVKQYGKIVDTKTEGLNFDLWITKKYEIYDLKTQEITTDIAAYSLDAQTMEATFTMQYRIQADKVKDINREYGNLEVLEERITAVAIEKAKVVLASQSAMQIIENRSTLSSVLEQEINKAIVPYHVTLELAVLTNIDFSDAFEQVVEDKMIAEQEKLKAEYEKEKAIIQAEQELEVAKKQAEAEIAKAEGDAEAQIAIAEAQAEAIRLKSLEIARMLGFEVINDVIIMEGHTPEEIKAISDYLQYVEYLNVWDGKLPNVVTGADSNVIVGIK